MIEVFQIENTNICLPEFPCMGGVYLKLGAYSELGA